MPNRIATLAAALCLALAASASAEDAKKSLVERLGFPAGKKVVILNGDDFGMNHSDNEATIKALRFGGLTSATIMMPCPWVPEVIKFATSNPQANLGLHLTLTSEWGGYKWSPVAGWKTVPSLCDELGYLLADVPPVYMKAKIADVETEVRAQVERAYLAKIDVTHIDSHMGTLQYNPKYHELYIKIAKEFNLPCRMAGINLMKPRGGEYLIKMADDLGVLHPDWLYMDSPPKPEQTEEFWLKRLKELQPGMVSEIYIHAGEATEEMKATTGSWRTRTADAEFFASQKWLDALKAEGIGLTSYRELRELQRTGTAPAIKDYYGW